MNAAETKPASGTSDTRGRREARMHWGNAIGAELTDDRQKARFEAVRRRVFEEMQEVTTRKRTAMMVPFQIVVLSILAARGAPPARLAIQLMAFALCLVFLAIGERTKHSERAVAAFVAASGCVLVSVGNTGGLSSPLLISVVPFLVGHSMNPNLDRKRYAILAFFIVGFVFMAVCAHTTFFELTKPLAPQIRFASGEYVALSLVSATSAALAIFKMGRAVSCAYERIALELAVRREELCDESEGRTRALEGIAARLAHEVKNPLAAIKGLSSHVARSATDETVRERLTIVASEAERLQDIVEGFLSFSRGLDELAIGPTRPYAIARELSLLLETRAADAGVSLEVRGSHELSLNADTKKIRQALLNLVLNAMHASARGTTVTLEVAKSCSDGAAVVRVMDRGTGMTEEVLSRISRPYFTTKEGGSGLGIAVARGIVEQHGGTLRFESVAGRGTTATVCLPACARAAQDKKTRLPDCGARAALALFSSSAVATDSHGHEDAGVGTLVSGELTKIPS